MVLTSVEHIVLSEEVNGVVKERHVLRDSKAEVVQVVLLLEDNLVSKLTRDEFDILGVGEAIEVS